MNARLKRPLLAIITSGALLAGGAAVGSPAYADPGTVPTTSAEPTTPSSPEPTTPVTGDPADPSDPGTGSDEPTGDPSAPPSQDPSAPPSEDPSAPPSQDPSAPPSQDPSTPPSTPPTSPSTPPAPPKDTVAPTGKIKLNSSGLWVGQKLTLTQDGVTDNSGAAQVTRTVNWGDSTYATLKAGQVATKTYGTARKYTITLTLRDKAGNTRKVTSVVNITKPGTFKVDRNSLWHGQRVKVTIGGVPSGTRRIQYDWGDGDVRMIPAKNQSFNGIFYRHIKTGALVKGKVTMRARFENKFGWSAPVTVAVVTVKTDNWKPTVKIKKPASANRLKSWKTVSGTVADKGSGVTHAFVLVSRVTGGKEYCLTPKKQWKRITSDAQWYKLCLGTAVKVNKGKWSMKVPGLKKGTVYVDAWAYDWSDNRSKQVWISSKVTRS